MNETRNILVTGGASGLGRAVVEQLLDRGDAVAVLDRAPDGAERAHHVQVDLADTRAAEEAVAAARGRVTKSANARRIARAWDATESTGTAADSIQTPRSWNSRSVDDQTERRDASSRANSSAANSRATRSSAFRPGTR